MSKQIKTATIILMIICIYCGIPIFILLGLLSFDYKFYYLTFGAILVYAVMRVLGFDNSEMGITFKETRSSIKHVIPITVALLVAAIILFFTGRGQRFQPNETVMFYFFYLFISSPVQEFLYRGALKRMLDYLGASETSKMILSTASYSFVHTIYHDPLTLLLTFIIGLIWYKCYIKTDNLIGVSISHAVLGIATIVTGVID